MFNFSVMFYVFLVLWGVEVAWEYLVLVRIGVGVIYKELAVV